MSQPSSPPSCRPCEKGARRTNQVVGLSVLVACVTLVAMLVCVVPPHSISDRDGETREYQRIIMASVGKFHFIKERPPERLHGWDDAEGFADNATWRMRTLVYELNNVQACVDIYSQLPMRAFEPPQDGLAAEWNTGVFLDAYGQPMDWDPTGGHGGVPVLISAGPDGKFGNDGSNAQADNIRSDEPSHD